MRNTGKLSEEIFDAYWARFGKYAYVHKFTDAATVAGLNKRQVLLAPNQPADRLVTVKGETFYAEVKSTTSQTSFPFSAIRPNQKAASRRVTKAGGAYFFFLHNLSTGVWYRVPAQVIHALEDAGRKSVKWSEIDGFKYPIH